MLPSPRGYKCMLLILVQVVFSIIPLTSNYPVDQEQCYNHGQRFNESPVGPWMQLIKAPASHTSSGEHGLSHYVWNWDHLSSGLERPLSHVKDLRSTDKPSMCESLARDEIRRWGVMQKCLWMPKVQAPQKWHWFYISWKIYVLWSGKTHRMSCGWILPIRIDLAKTMLLLYTCNIVWHFTFKKS